MAEVAYDGEAALKATSGPDFVMVVYIEARNER